LLVAITNVDPVRSAPIDIALGGSFSGVAGETLTAPKVDSINTFEAPDVVTPKPLTATVQAGRLQTTVEPKSVSVFVLTP
jgi:alpha-L-arabinofuranosidase